ncbi:hypothetical protein Bhyg_03886, partial [Pseudolycoriella hygida]
MDAKNSLEELKKVFTKFRSVADHINMLQASMNLSMGTKQNEDSEVQQNSSLNGGAINKSFEINGGSSASISLN